MSEFFFGAGNGRVSQREGKRCDKIAQKHGASFVWVAMPEGHRFWFASPNRGNPFDRDTAAAVMAEVGRVQVRVVRS